MSSFSAPLYLFILFEEIRRCVWGGLSYVGTLPPDLFFDEVLVLNFAYQYSFYVTRDEVWFMKIEREDGGEFMEVCWVEDCLLLKTNVYYWSIRLEVGRLLKQASTKRKTSFVKRKHPPLLN